MFQGKPFTLLLAVTSSLIVLLPFESKAYRQLEDVNATNATSNGLLCPLIGFLPFTHGETEPLEYDIDGNAYPSQQAFTHLSSALLAIDHFNSRNPIVIPELDHYTKNCSVQIPTSPELLRFADSKARVTNVPKFLVSEISSQKKICSIVGPYMSETSLEASTFSSGLDVVTVSHGADDSRLSLESHPLFVRTSTNLHPIGEAVVSWLRHIGRTNYLFVIHVAADYGTFFAQSIENAAKESNFTHVVVNKVAPPFIGFISGTSIRRAFYECKKSGFRTILIALQEIDSKPFRLMADAAEEYGLNNGEYVFVIVTPNTIPLSHFAHLASTSKNENVTKLISGAATIRILDGFTHDKDDAFLQEWKKQDALFVERVNALHPIQDQDQSGYFQAPSNYFQTSLPVPGSAYMYDAIMSIGLGKCQEEKKEDVTSNQKKPKGQAKQGGTQRYLQGNSSQSPPPNSGGGGGGRKRQSKAPVNKHLVEIVKLKFTGSTGTIEYGENDGRQPRNRNRDTITYGIYNFKKIEGDQENQRDNATNRYWYYLSNILQDGSVDGTWTTISPFIYADETPTPPILLRDIPEQNYLSRGVRTFGLTFMSISLFLSVLVVIFIKRHENYKIIRSSQPTFLYILCFGTIVMSSAIITLSYDESYGWSDSQLDSACLAFPWLVSLGYITIYCALFMKLWRINQVLQFRRRTVKVRHVFGPFLLLVLAAVAVLTIWSVLDPLSWERNIISIETGESYGQCVSNNDIIYISCLASLMCLSTLMTAFMAYKTKDIDDRFSESSWIFYTIFVQIQVIIVGIPILIILEDSSADATYFGRVVLIWMIPMSTLLLMFAPKIVAVFSPTDVSNSNQRVSQRGSSIQTGVQVSSSVRTSLRASSRVISDPSSSAHEKQPYSSQGSSHYSSYHSYVERDDVAESTASETTPSTECSNTISSNTQATPASLSTTADDAATKMKITDCKQEVDSNERTSDEDSTGSSDTETA